ncbi:TRAP transporter substrate-binding protein [Actinotalea sp. K2]|uniref:TRAP transporter substrate-binding protein n=1 Tax=Actinotalea sp. K2 TaxID=2939438 RepID=UPI002017E0A9|nr:TRAP transporter substrate-binding protein [Actinotalea sp. K2]MCL3861799.1 TRAP transporter substrate-binding protein [Actinotalea sp. K2]
MAVTLLAGLVLAGCAGDAEPGATGAPEATSGESGTAGGSVEWRIALNQTADHPITVSVQGMADRVNELTEGRVDIEVFPNESLGAQAEALQLVADGTIELAIISGPQLENMNTDFLVFNLPLVFDDIDHQMSVVNDDEIVGDLYASLEDRNVSVLGAYTAGDRNIYTTDKPIVTPADTAGLKIRVQESETHLKMIELMGGSPTPMAFGEVYTALQSGVLDGAENNEVSYVSQRHVEVAPYFSYTRHLIVPDYLVASTSSLDELSAEDRAIFDEEFLASVEEQVALWATATDEAIAAMEEAGVEFSDVDTSLFADAIAPLVDSSLTSDNARAIYDATRAAAA